jgi:omega-6 fatty acid desaturase (delta-12 desaturase)
VTVTDPPAAQRSAAALDPEAPRSLKPVLEVIPEECYDNPTARGLGYFARDVVMYGVLLFALFSTDKIYFLIPLWIVISIVVGGLFVVGHDAAHQSLFKSKRLNGIIGRLSFLPSLHVFEAWVLGHNRVHHGHTVKAQFDFVWHPVTAEEYANLSRRGRFMHRVEWSVLGYGVYYGRTVWWEKMMSFEPPKRWAQAIKRDTLFLKSVTGVIGIGMLALGWWQYGSVLGAIWMLTKLGVVPFIGFCYVIGMIVHIHHIDADINWHERKHWTKFRGQVEGTTIIHSPWWVEFFLHWILEHSPHHVDMRIPMYHLKEAGAAIAEHFPVPERKLRVRDIFANSRACKLYDFETRQWMTYREARAMLVEAAPAAI